jgi:hypothetical protein
MQLATSYLLFFGPEYWLPAEVHGTRPPPCSSFSLTKMNECSVLLFGGDHHGRGITNDLYLLDLKRMVSGSFRLNLFIW